MTDAQPGRRSRELVVQREVEGEVGGGDVLDDDIVGAGDEDAAAPVRIGGGGRHLAGGEVDGAAVVVGLGAGRSAQP